MKKRFLRDLKPGDRFLLLRTGETYTFVRRGEPPKGSAPVVLRYGDSEETTLHHRCRVAVVRQPRCIWCGAPVTRPDRGRFWCDACNERRMANIDRDFEKLMKELDEMKTREEAR
ncbi:MAG: hypothetical protein LBD68_00035 [Zoogloeaceae bacterium]|jgi:hypothetical protein|nr:hypothetical protein [Zoogloeaceae bacterium]